MLRDKSKDSQFFDWYYEHEIDYVSGLYPDRERVRAFLKAKCDNGEIRHFNHKEIYYLIEKLLGYPMPN
jgi:hypothetical protein